MFKLSIRYKGLLILLLFIGMLAGCGTTDKMEFYNDTESTTLSEEINSISIDSREDKVRQIFGVPISIEEVENNDSNHLVYDDLEFQIKMIKS